jgi:hypothetical protein
MLNLVVRALYINTNFAFAVNTHVWGKNPSVNALYGNFMFLESCVLMTQWKKSNWSAIIMVLHTRKTGINTKVLECYCAIKSG